MRFTFTFHLALVWSICTAQTVSKIDSLKRELLTVKADTSRMQIMLELRIQYDLVNVDSTLLYSQQALNLAQRIQYSKGEARALYAVGSAYRRMGEIPKGLEFIYKGLQIATDTQDSAGLAAGYNHIGLIHFDLDEYLNAISYFQEALKLNENIHDEGQEVYLLMRIAYAYSKNNQLDSASTYMQKAINKWRKLKLSDSFNGLFFELIGEIQFALNDRSLGFDYLEKSIQINQKNNFLLTGAIAHIVIAGFYKEFGQIDSAIFHAKQGLVEAKVYGVKKRVLEASSLLAELYESKDLEEALYYRKVYDSANEELYGRRKVQDLQKILSKEQERQRQNEYQKIAYQNKIKQYSLLAGLGLFLMIAFLLYRNNRHKQKANILLQQQKEKVEITLRELKSTQAQLIQSEKMASLGELTAGIAHEIQNPLNFVNNFSEVNKELLTEVKDEMQKGNYNEAEEIVDNVIGNEEKINHHGKRADAIVKGMLQHSRVSTGQKEPTDINALADEYLRLSYHGMRAKDKSFNATLQTDFDSTIEKINIVPQDIGRVLLNLFNNAFYAVQQKKNLTGFENLSGLSSYEPTVSLNTKKLDGKVFLSVKDNGNGIPQKVVDKIFQPFFTTKPTGQGTGLGLSLSYDIVKAHGGEIKVETKEGDGSVFIIQLPL
jgi:two-component system NtrC family sensor kinase